MIPQNPQFIQMLMNAMAQRRAMPQPQGGRVGPFGNAPRPQQMPQPMPTGIPGAQQAGGSGGWQSSLPVMAQAMGQGLRNAMGPQQGPGNPISGQALQGLIQGAQAAGGSGMAGGSIPGGMMPPRQGTGLAGGSMPSYGGLASALPGLVGGGLPQSLPSAGGAAGGGWGSMPPQGAVGMSPDIAAIIARMTGNGG